MNDNITFTAAGGGTLQVGFCLLLKPHTDLACVKHAVHGRYFHDYSPHKVGLGKGSSDAVIDLLGQLGAV